MLIADLHIHSKYSRATSKEGIPEYLDLWADRKGIGLLGTGDFTHPAWRERLKETLTPAEEGLYVLKQDLRAPGKRFGEAPRFVVSGEISSIYKKNGKVRKVHNLILLPGLEQAERLSKKLEAIGNIHSDGRPILGIDSRDLLEITLDACPNAVFIPAHIWTPHFSMFGAFSGFDTIEECFEDLTPYIHAFETGLSSDPPMNWRVSALDRLTMVSNSDAHSPAKLGREANLMEIDLSYHAMAKAIQEGAPGGFRGTIEFFPEEGKYHYDGHRSCHLCLRPAQTKQYDGKCPVCGKKLTIGVDHRVEDLADRKEGYRPKNALPFESLVPLPEVIAASTGRSAGSKKVLAEYGKMLESLGAEFYILREAPLEDIRIAAGPCIEEGIRRLRNGKVEWEPGYDGEYGKLKPLSASEIDELNGQLSFLPVTGIAERKQKTEEKPNLPKLQKQSEEQSQAVAQLLNEEQQQAVNSKASAVAVAAGPGTGKTKTLISRLCHLIREQGVKPSEITAVTFTNQAAKEMRERLERELGSKRQANQVRIGTFHAVCLRQLQQNGAFHAILDPCQAESFAREVLDRFSISWRPKRFLQEVSSCKNKLIKSSDTLREEWYEAYEQLLSQAQAMDFDDLLLFGKKLWEDNVSFRKKERKRFSYLLVDEFQDINEIQYQLVCAWAGNGNRLFVIGDPDQAIYGFRGARADCFDRLKADFPDCEMIRLRTNYRSSPEIIQCALASIRHNPGGERLLLAESKSKGPVVAVQAESELSQGIELAKRINRMVGGMDMLEAHAFGQEQELPRSFSEIAVLYRTRQQAEILEQCLRKESIPYVVVGKDDLLEDEQVRGVLSFFRFLENRKDKLALRDCLQYLFQLTDPDGICDEILKNGLGEPGPEEKEAFPLWLTLFWEFSSHFTKQRPEKLLGDLVSRLGMEVSEGVKKLLHMAVFYQSMVEFLQALMIGEEADWKRRSEKNYSADAVTLMTLHASKGLEFPVVFLAGVQEGYLPLSRGNLFSDIEEERRLFYVGMTRAREELNLLTAKEPSRFLKEIPRDLLQEETAKAPKERPVGKQLSFFS